MEMNLSEILDRLINAPCEKSSQYFDASLSVLVLPPPAQMCPGAHTC